MRGTRRLGTFTALAAIVAAVGCPRGGGNGAATTEPPPAAAGEGSGMKLHSPDFEAGAPIPKQHAYRPEGDNVPPTLVWSGVPSGTKELALVVDDPDAPTPEPWVHDVLYGIPPDATPLDAARRQSPGAPGRLVKGTNSWTEAGWGGPLPPPGSPHRYVFTLYALDASVSLPAGQTKEQLLEAIEGHVLGTATVTGTYQRSR